MARIAGGGGSRWPLLGLTIIHRIGKIRPGEPIVLVLCASSHRAGGFFRRRIPDGFPESRAPFWKKEHRADGTQGGWVEAKDADEAALERWSK